MDLDLTQLGEFFEYAAKQNPVAFSLIAIVVIVVMLLVLANRTLPGLISGQRDDDKGNRELIKKTVDQHGETLQMLREKQTQDITRDDILAGIQRGLDESTKALGALVESQASQHATLESRIDRVQIRVLEEISKQLASAESRLMEAIEHSAGNGTPMNIGVFRVGPDGVIRWADDITKDILGDVKGGSVFSDSHNVYNTQGDEIPVNKHPVAMSIRDRVNRITMVGIKRKENDSGKHWVLLRIEQIFEDQRYDGASVILVEISSILNTMAAAIEQAK